MIEVRINETLELHNEDGLGRGASVGLEGAGWSRPSLYRSAIVGIEDSWTGADISYWWYSMVVQSFVLTRRHSAGDCLAHLPTLCISEARRPVPPCMHIRSSLGGQFRLLSSIFSLWCSYAMECLIIERQYYLMSYPSNSKHFGSRSFAE